MAKRWNTGDGVGTLVMGPDGFIMWNPIATAKLVPGEWIPAAKAAQWRRAILAVLAISCGIL